MVGPLCDSDTIKYLGTILSTRNESHITSRIQAANRAFYALQAAGLKNNYRLSPETAVNIYYTAVRSLLIYGCSSFHLSKSQVQILDRTQGKHLKLLGPLCYKLITIVNCYLEAGLTCFFYCPIALYLIIFIVWHPF